MTGRPLPAALVAGRAEIGLCGFSQLRQSGHDVWMGVRNVGGRANVCLDVKQQRPGRLASPEMRMTRERVERHEQLPGTASHRLKLIHRDIKPANMMLRHNEPNQVVLTDFGLVRLADENNLTVKGTLIGTPAYMAPEAFRGEPLNEPRASTGDHGRGGHRYGSRTPRSLGARWQGCRSRVPSSDGLTPWAAR